MNSKRDAMMQRNSNRTEHGTEDEELRKRLNDYNYDGSEPNANAQMSQLSVSDIDEGDENESERSTTPRRRTRGRSVDLNSRRLSGWFEYKYKIADEIEIFVS